MKVAIRPALPSDIAGVLRLMTEFADHVALSGQLTANEDRLSEAVFGDGAFVELLIAEEKGDLVGYAIYFPHFSSFRAERGYYLEDIFLTEHCRGKGIGFEMLKYIARQAVTLGFNRIDFQVLNSNATALRFYERLGAEVNQDEFRLKFSGPAFDHLAA